MSEEGENIVNDNIDDTSEKKLDKVEDVMQVDIKEDGEVGENSMGHITEVLDDLEQQVESLRASAILLAEDRDDVLTTLETVGHEDNLASLAEVDRGEVAATVARLAARAAAIEVNVVTPRGESQAEALHQVNTAIDQLILVIQTDCKKAEDICQTYISACDMDLGNQSSADSRFEKVLLGCTAEDQKVIKKRLIGLLEHIKAIKIEVNVEEDK